MLIESLLLLFAQDVVVEMNDGVREIGPVRVEVRNRGIDDGGRKAPRPGQRSFSDEDLDSEELGDCWS